MKCKDASPADVQVQVQFHNGSNKRVGVSIYGRNDNNDKQEYCCYFCSSGLRCSIRLSSRHEGT